MNFPISRARVGALLSCIVSLIAATGCPSPDSTIEAIDHAREETAHVDLVLSQLLRRELTVEAACAGDLAELGPLSSDERFCLHHGVINSRVGHGDQEHSAIHRADRLPSPRWGGYLAYLEDSALAYYGNWPRIESRCVEWQDSRVNLLIIAYDRTTCVREEPRWIVDERHFVSRRYLAALDRFRERLSRVCAGAEPVFAVAEARRALQGLNAALESGRNLIERIAEGTFVEEAAFRLDEWNESPGGSAPGAASEERGAVGMSGPSGPYENAEPARPHSAHSGRGL